MGVATNTRGGHSSSNSSFVGAEYSFILLTSPKLAHLLTTGNVDRLPCHITGLIRSQEHNNITYIIISASSPYRHLRFVLEAYLLLGEALRAGILLIKTFLPQGAI